MIRRGAQIVVNLLLMPILVSSVGLVLLAISAAVGGVMLLSRTTAGIGRKWLVYSLSSLTAGVVSCWAGFGAMIAFWPLEGQAVHFGNAIIPVPFAIFWASARCGMLVGVILAHGFLADRD